MTSPEGGVPPADGAESEAAEDFGALEALHELDELDELDASDDALGAASDVLAAEYLADLQRLQAEYINYRKRVERDRVAVVDAAIGRVVEGLIPALDDIAAARAHGELTGPFAAIAEKIEASLGRFGWSAYGATGDLFDPGLHEALVSSPEAGIKVPTVREVAQPGHMFGDRVLRAARVVVVQPE